MDTILEQLSRGVEQLLGRAGGPMHLRLVIQPIIAAILALRACSRDARISRSTPRETPPTGSESKRGFLRSGWKDIGRLFTLAVVLDVAYQVYMFHTVYPVQTLIVSVGVAWVPYALIRGVVAFVSRRRTASGGDQPDSSS